MPVSLAQALCSKRLRVVVFGLLLVTPGRTQDRQLCGQSYTKAQEVRQQKKLREARLHLNDCLRSCSGALAADCLQWTREVEGALPSVVFRGRRAGGDELHSVSVFLDGTKLTERLDGQAIELDPGTHTFEFRYEQEQITRTETIREGEKNRLIEIEFPPIQAPLASASASAEHPDPRPLPTPTPPPPSLSSPPRSPWILPLFVLGGVALTGTGVLGYTTMTRAEELRKECAPGCPGDDVDALRARRNVADVLLGVGILSLGGAAYLAWFHKPAAVSVGPRWLGVSGRF